MSVRSEKMQNKKNKIHKMLFCVVVISFLFVFFLAGCKKAPSGETQITDRSLLDIKEKGKLVVGSDVPYGVMEFFDESGNIVGLDIDIVQEIVDGFGVELVVRDVVWEELFNAVKSGEIDVAISSITITPERSEEMLFSIPYFNGGQSIVVKKDNENIKLPDDLKDKKVGVQIESTGLYAVQEYTPDELISTYQNTEEIVDAINAESVDAVVVDYIAAIGIANEDSLLKIVGEPFTQEYYGIATKLGNHALMDEVNKILREMKRTGRLDEIKGKWV